MYSNSKSVIQSSVSRYNSGVNKKQTVYSKFALGLFFWFLLSTALLCTIVLPPALLTRMGLTAFQSGDFSDAAQYWQQANYIVEPLGTFMKPLSSDGLLWSTTLTLGENLANDLAQLRQAKWQSVYDLPLDTLVGHLPDYIILLDSIQSNAESAHLLKLSTLAKDAISKIAVAQEWLAALAPTLNAKSKWIVLLQNDNELRATGGFMGSYALLSINHGKIVEFSIEDIYDVDGQFTGYFPPPAGVKEYLSSGNGLRLPDSNWSPDFPSSAQQVLAYFALGNRQEIVGVVAITNSVVSEMLKITGPIVLPDYEASITAETIDSVLQNRPQPFFPGSIQKKHMLSQAKNQLLVTLGSLSTNDWKNLFVLLNQQIQKKNILFYSVNDSINSLLINQDIPTISGYLLPHPGSSHP